MDRIRIAPSYVDTRLQIVVESPEEKPLGTCTEQRCASRVIVRRFRIVTSTREIAPSRHVARPARLVVRGFELRDEHDVLGGALRERPVHEPERFGGVRFDSWTDQAAIF